MFSCFIKIQYISFFFIKMVKKIKWLLINGWSIIHSQVITILNYFLKCNAGSWFIKILIWENSFALIP